MHHSKTLVMTFTRNPELGKVKSRLAQGIGEKAALEVYVTLLAHTEKVLRQIEADKCVWYSVEVRKDDLWDDAIYQKKAQVGNDLGERMQNAFTDAFQQQYEKVIIIGSDLYDLKPKHIQEAMEALNHHDVVIGPANDGGYYLLGMNKMHNEAFLPKDWGTATVLKDTINDLNTEKIYRLETLNDIDYAEDLLPYKTFKKYIS